MASGVADFMLQTCTLSAPGAPDMWGAVTYGAGTSTECRAWRQTERVKVADGEIVETKVVMHLPADTTVEPEYRATDISGVPGTFTVRAVVAVPWIDNTVVHILAYLD